MPGAIKRIPMVIDKTRPLINGNQKVTAEVYHHKATLLKGIDRYAQNEENTG